ncbi:MAG TPA: ATP synthase F0 subunit A [Phycisphaerales bacterium]|nr:ATP synthase F0 subunit A [Phycisphaerales bacterium]|tara:strand:+ start:283 stop:1224 length:942 start_codon:yes stop_codon:yes gene_type:complete
MNYLLAAAGEKHTPLGHVLDKEILDVGMIGNISMQMVTMLLGVVLLLIILPRAAKAIQTGPESEGYERYVTKGRLSQLIEVIALYLRDVMLEPVMGEKDTRKYFPFLMTMFFFILMMNLLGLIPLPDVQNIIGKFTMGDDHWSVIGGTPTSNINITIALAIVSFVMIQIHSFRELGILGWLDHLTCGLTKGPKFLLVVVPVIFVVELAGVFIKPVALAIRLFANMVGGHVLLATLLLLGSTFMHEGASPGVVAGVSVVSGIAAVLITFLELFVAFLQAFIFMFLTAVFISLMSHHDEHDDEHAHEEGASQPAH